MCDYSLEMYRSRPALAGEQYDTMRFPSGSLGFVAAGDPHTAICMACDTTLELTKLPPELQSRIGVGETERVTFIRIEAGPYHDGVRFANGSEVTLQQLGPGVTARVVDSLVEPTKVVERPLELEPAE